MQATRRAFLTALTRGAAVTTAISIGTVNATLTNVHTKYEQAANQFLITRNIHTEIGDRETVFTEEAVPYNHQRATEVGKILYKSYNTMLDIFIEQYDADSVEDMLFMVALLRHTYKIDDMEINNGLSPSFGTVVTTFGDSLLWNKDSKVSVYINKLLDDDGVGIPDILQGYLPEFKGPRRIT